MKQGKYAAPVRRRRRRNTLKPMLIAMAVVLLLGCVTGGTLAWLTATTTPVTNTFTVGNINITLAETTSNYKMIPGWTISKDPKVTVLKDSEDCLLLVKVTKSTNFDDFMSYTPAAGWTKLDSKSTALVDVYYREVTNITSDNAFYVLADNKVSVKESVTKTMMDNLTDTTRPTLTFEAAAVQLIKDGTTEFTPAEAYDAAWPTTTP